MRIEYKATRHRMTVSEAAGKRLVAAGIAREVTETPKPTAKPEAVDKPRRTYRRRDMQAAEGASTPEPATAGGYVTRDEQADPE